MKNNQKKVNEITNDFEEMKKRLLELQEEELNEVVGGVGEIEPVRCWCTYICPVCHGVHKFTFSWDNLLRDLFLCTSQEGCSKAYVSKVNVKNKTIDFGNSFDNIITVNYEYESIEYNGEIVNGQ